MSKRRKQSPARPKVKDVYVARPFAGLVDETDWVAMRELVPAATAPVRLTAELAAKYGEREVTVSTVLPLAWPALVKPDGRIFIGLQRGAQSGDVSRDLALSLLLALEAEPGGPVGVPPLPGPGPRLQDVLAPQQMEISLHDGFDFWVDEQAMDGEVKASLERANAAVFPSVKLSAAPSAYWCRFPDKSHVRWVLPDEEESALDALARLSASGGLSLGEGTRFAGMFRAHGLLVPVWDLPPSELPPEQEAPRWEEPVTQAAARYREALAEGASLDSDQRRARQSLLARQVTVR